MVIELCVVQFWSEIILVISNQTRAARSFDFEITRMISDQIALHSVQLPLLIYNFTCEITKLLWQRFLYHSAKMASRFKDVTDEEVTALKDAAENLNTRKSTINWVRVFENWCDENGLEKNPETVRPEQLDKVLERFFPCLCKQDETDYEPGSLKVMQAALDCHLKEKGYSFSIIKAENFSIPEKFLRERRVS